MTNRPKSPRIVDGHAHVSSTLFIPDEFLAETARNLQTRLDAYGQRTSSRFVEMVVQQHQDHQADELVAAMDSAGIAEAVLLIPDFSLVMKCRLSPEEAAEHHHRIKLRHPGRFRVFPGLDPRHGPETAGMFQRWIDDYGFDGLKLYPPSGFSPSDRRLDEVYEICSQRGLPVLLHTGPTVQTLDFQFSDPGLIDEAARRFSGVNFILAHGGVSNVQQCATLCAYRQNVYMDVAGFTTALDSKGWQANLANVLRLGIPHKVIFGTDWPINRMSGGLSTLLNNVCVSEVLESVGEREQVMFFSANIDRLLGARS